MRLLWFFVFAFTLGTPAFSQIGAKVQQAGKIHGIWHNSQFGYQMTLILNQDGSGEFDGESIKYVHQGGQLSITMSGTKTDYNCNLQGNLLTLSGGDLQGAVTFSKEGAGVETQSSYASGSSKVGVSFSNTSSDLLGIWSGNGEMIEFKPDGNCIYLGNTFPYQVSQDHIILNTNQGNATFGYSVKGKTLTLIANGQQVVYNKAMGSATGSTSGGASASGGKVAMELVGQWCYMNMTNNSQTSRCITLNADGTYTYSSESSRSVSTNEFYGGTNSQGGDRGTWYVQGDRIYYQSQSTGQGSYRLEKRNHPKNVNDPMIVLDGEPYVTATARQPWR